MSLGEKLRQARLDAGLSQRELCGGEITRNMLSCIENGTAQPSMRTLQFLAGRLGKPVSYFLEEKAVVSVNQTVMASARQQYDAEQYERAMAVLEKYTEPDPVYDREKALLTILVQLGLAEQAIAQHREQYARPLPQVQPPPQDFLLRQAPLMQSEYSRSAQDFPPRSEGQACFRQAHLPECARYRPSQQQAFLQWCIPRQALRQPPLSR